MDLYNAYNHASSDAPVYNYNFTRKSYQTGLPILPILGLRGEF
jgi:hypothetical protein